MNQVLKVYKPIGLTPLQLLDLIRQRHPELGQEKLSYAGRLDPMAEGVMLILVGEENKNREKYLGLDKEYEFEMIFGISTDSYDVLGLVEKIDPDVKVGKVEVKRMLKQLVGKITLPYPPYSSKTVVGKPLWWWVRNNQLGEIEIPTTTVEIYSLDLLGVRSESASKILDTITAKVHQATGDFRQETILEKWEETLKGTETNFLICKCRIHCSSGTYVRSIVHDIGRKLKTGGMTYTIRRTRIGEAYLEHTQV